MSSRRFSTPPWWIFFAMALLLGTEIVMAALGRAHWLLPGLCLITFVVAYFSSAWYSARYHSRLARRER